jgi:hypothetical protein
VRDAVAVLYRQAGLIVLCALAGSAVSLVPSLRQPRLPASIAKAAVQTGQPGARLLLSAVGPAQDGGGLKLDLDLESESESESESGAGNGSAPVAVALTAQTLEPQLRLDLIDLFLRPGSSEGERRLIVEAPDHPRVAESEKNRRVALLGPLAGLLLGLMLAGLRELGGDRMRSVGEAEWALGVPVLGGIPTLSAKARNDYFRPALATTTAFA